MQTKEIMTKTVDWVSPDMTIDKAAEIMKKDDVGCLPVGENDRLVGMLTDRDIVLNCTAEGKSPSSTTVREVMTASVRYVFDEDDVNDVAKNMANNKVRRMPVLNKDKRLVGIVTLGDVARHSDGSAAAALKEISTAP